MFLLPHPINGSQRIKTNIPTSRFIENTKTTAFLPSPNLMKSPKEPKEKAEEAA